MFIEDERTIVNELFPIINWMKDEKPHTFKRRRLKYLTGYHTANHPTVITVKKIIVTSM